MNSIRTIRVQRGLTPAQLAERVGCATVTIHQVERGTRSPSLRLARRIADELFVSLDEFYPGQVAHA